MRKIHKIVTLLCVSDCTGNWGSYGTCTATCDGGTQERTYTMIDPPLNGGSCPSSPETRTCNETPCSPETIQCIRPSTLGYDYTNEADLSSALYDDSFNASLSCDNGYYGAPSTTACITDGGAYEVIGCFNWSPIIQLLPDPDNNASVADVNIYKNLICNFYRFQNEITQRSPELSQASVEEYRLSIPATDMTDSIRDELIALDYVVDNGGCP